MVGGDEQDVYVGFLFIYSVILVYIYQRQQGSPRTPMSRHHITEEEYQNIKERITDVFYYISRKTNMHP